MSMCEEQDRRQQWLATLAPGSDVFIKARRGAHGNALHPRKVVRTTATQAILDRGERYRLKDGREVGDSGNWIVEPTPECWAIWQAAENRNRLSSETGYLNDSRSKLNDEEIAAMLAALDAVRGNGDSEGREELEAAQDYAEDLEVTLELVAKALGVPAEPHQGRAERVLGAAEAMAAHLEHSKALNKEGFDNALNDGFDWQGWNERMRAFIGEATTGSLTHRDARKQVEILEALLQKCEEATCPDTFRCHARNMIRTLSQADEGDQI